MKIYLLTHERELQRKTNTGAIAIANIPNLVERIIWQRTAPNKELIHLIKNNQAILLYAKDELLLNAEPKITARNSTLSPVLDPTKQSQDEPLSPENYESYAKYENIIIIDSTWQEAKKIFKQSPYLQHSPFFTLKTPNKSLYKRRANQLEGGLCTIECIIKVLKLKGQDEIAQALQVKFTEFNG